MSNRKDFEFLCDIAEAGRRIGGYAGKMTYDQFLGDLKTQDAVVRNLEIIGEATKNISSEIKTKYMSIPWKDLAGARDRLIHHYFGVNYDVVWVIISEELPEVLRSIDGIIKQGKDSF
jgi:uncharacterized protein with HEPN domain